MDRNFQDITSYFKKERSRPRAFLGQLQPEFQQGLAAFHANVREEDCEFYHTIKMPDGRVIKGAWDLTGHEADYLGNISFSGQKVLEYGPASGFLSRVIAEAGADLTVFDLPIGSGPEIMPFANVDLQAQRDSGAISAGRLRNSWWFYKNLTKFPANAVYADIFNQPSDLGMYDISIFGAILVHLPNPFQALREAAAMTKDMMIITDLVTLPPIEQLPGLMQIGTSPPPVGHIHWWNYSASAFQTMLSRLGFEKQTMFLHSPRAMKESSPPMVTVVGRRS